MQVSVACYQFCWHFYLFVCEQYSSDAILHALTLPPLIPFTLVMFTAGDMVPTSEPTLEPSLEPTEDGANGLLTSSRAAAVVDGGAVAAWASFVVGALFALF